MLYRDLQKTSKTLQRSLGINPMANDKVTSEGDQKIPENHLIMVSDRIISVDNKRLVQNNINTDTMDIQLDGEWKDVNVVVILGERDEAVQLRWSGQPIVIPSQVAKNIGPVAVSIVGLDANGETRLVTVKNSSVFNVIESGEYIGNIPEAEAKDILGQLLDSATEADEAAKKATEAAKNAQTAADNASAVTAVEFGDGAPGKDVNGLMYIDTSNYDVYKRSE